MLLANGFRHRLRQLEIVPKKLWKELEVMFDLVPLQPTCPPYHVPLGLLCQTGCAEATDSDIDGASADHDGFSACTRSREPSNVVSPASGVMSTSRAGSQRAKGSSIVHPTAPCRCSHWPHHYISRAFSNLPVAQVHSQSDALIRLLRASDGVQS